MKYLVKVMRHNYHGRGKCDDQIIMTKVVNGVKAAERLADKYCSPKNYVLCSIIGWQVVHLIEK